jgi:hypothetical protein
MAKEPRIIRVTPDSELAVLIEHASLEGEPLMVDTGKAVYRLDVSRGATDGSSTTAPPSERPPRAEEVERSREGILKSAGGWRDVDTEAFKAYIYERRRTSSRRRLSW